MMILDLPLPINKKQHLLEDKQGEDENRNAQAAIKQDYSNSTATVQPRCGNERDSFQLGVEAVCRPGTPEQWWRWWWLWTRTRRWRGVWKKDSSSTDAPSTTAVQQGRRYGGGGRRLGGGQWGGQWIGCVGVVMHIPTHSGEKPFNRAQCDYSCTTTSHLWVV